MCADSILTNAKGGTSDDLPCRRCQGRGKVLHAVPDGIDAICRSVEIPCLFCQPHPAAAKT